MILKLFQQSVNQKVFEYLMQYYFAMTELDAMSEVVLGKDELNAVRYAAGFVPNLNYDTECIGTTFVQYNSAVKQLQW